MLNFFNYLKALFKQPKPQFVSSKGMPREASAMLEVLTMAENERVPKYCFYDVGIHNPGRAKSTLVNKYGKVILCRWEGTGKNVKTSWMLITNPLIARGNMTEKERKEYTLDHLYNLQFGG